jgi:hypothetical protein
MVTLNMSSANRCAYVHVHVPCYVAIAPSSSFVAAADMRKLEYVDLEPRHMDMDDSNQNQKVHPRIAHPYSPPAATRAA